MTATLSAPQSIESWLGEEGEDLLTYKAKVSQDLLHLPGSDFIDRIWTVSDRSPKCYALSSSYILPVDWLIRVISLSCL
jgi:hypothetical protein